MRITVEAYSGYKANERPRAIRFDEKALEVTEVLDKWYGTDHEYFKLRADDGYVYIIRYDIIGDFWELVMMEKA